MKYTKRKDRIQKPRTPAQRAHAAKYSASHGTPPSVTPADAGLPHESWWTRAKSREEFSARAAAEQPRIQHSKFATGGLILAKDSERAAVERVPTEVL